MATIFSGERIEEVIDDTGQESLSGSHIAGSTTLKTTVSDEVCKVHVGVRVSTNGSVTDTGNVRVKNNGATIITIAWGTSTNNYYALAEVDVAASTSLTLEWDSGTSGVKTIDWTIGGADLIQYTRA